MDVLHILFILIILALLLAYFIGKKQDDKETKNTALLLARKEQEVTSLQAEKASLQAALRADIEELKSELNQERDRYMDSERKLEKIQSYFMAQSQKVADQKAELSELKSQMTKEFELIANKILQDKSDRFSESSHKSLFQILDPFKENLKTFEEKVDRVYHEESKDRNSLKGAVALLIEQSKQIQDEASNLTKALKGDNKKQGNWGEVILEKVLERSGLVKDREYRLQASFTNPTGQRVQPDAIIDLPDEKNLVIDSKVSLVAYERWINAEDEAARTAHARQHLLSVRTHVTELSAKNYCDLYQINSPDFVLLFIPIESSFSLSVSLDNDLFNFAWDRRVVIVSPSTLLATLRTIAGLWKQERQNRNVLEIAREAGLLYDKFVGFTEDMDKVEKQIHQLARTHEEARKKLETGRGNVMSKMEKLKILGARTSKELDPKYMDEETLLP